MTRFVMTMMIVSATGLAAAAAAAPSVRPLSHRQQVNACMTKAMMARRTLSYNEANKLCKAQLQANLATLAANRSPKP